jgi:hypothetical protein
MMIWLVCLSASLNWICTEASAACLNPPSGLVAWWRAEGNAVDSAGTNNGTILGSTTFGTGEVGQAFRFNGTTNTYVQIPDSPTFNFSNAMTIELWAYRTGLETTMELVGKRKPNCGSAYFMMLFSPGLGLEFFSGGFVDTGVQMPLNSWMHLAATIDGSLTTFYTNGVQCGVSGPGGLYDTNNAPVTIGTGGCSPFNGLIDEVSLYNRALSSNEIAAIYAIGASGKCLGSPIIVTNPLSQTALVGENVTFSVSATGSTPLSYQWMLGGTNISGATQRSLTVTNVQLAQNGNSYSVLVSNTANIALSSNANLTVKSPVPHHVVVLDQAGLLSGMAGGSTVVFDADGVIVLTQTVTVAQNTILDGTGHSVVISGGNSVPIFHVNSGVQFTLINLTIANGFNLGTNGNAAYVPGQTVFAGGLYNDHGIVGIINCAFSGNTAQGGVGASYADGGSASGGAIFNLFGSLNISNSTFSSNIVSGGLLGGGNPDDYSTFGSGGSAMGGAIYNQGGTILAKASTFNGNQAFTTGIGDRGGAKSLGSSLGGALFTTGGYVTIVNCGFLMNSVNAPGWPSPTNDVGAGGAIYQGSGVLNMNNVSFQTNNVMGGTQTPSGVCMGGGVFNSGVLGATNCAFLGNTAVGSTPPAFFANYYAPQGAGGAIFNFGNATIINASISGNSAAGGKAQSTSQNAEEAGQAYGGGIYNSNTLVLLGSTMSGNLASGGTDSPGFGGGAAGFGGGIFNAGTLHATNDTIYGNQATGDPNSVAGTANGGGFCSQGGAVTLVYQTISSNNASGTLDEGGGINITDGTLLLENSIVAGSTFGSNFYVPFGGLTDGGNNLSSDESFTFSSPTSHNNTDPMLGSLSDNGGPTKTMPLLAGSPAIDAANCADGPPYDQRGYLRPAGASCDIGAFEYGAVPVFTIGGVISGYIPPGGVNISDGARSVTSDGLGNYLFSGVVAGNYTVTPSAGPGVFFTPTSQIVTVGPSTTSVDFTDYRMNALTPENYVPPVVQFGFRGTNGQTWVVESSSNLINWIPIATNVVGTNGMFEFFVTNSPGQFRQFFRTRTP